MIDKKLAVEGPDKFVTIGSAEFAQHASLSHCDLSGPGKLVRVVYAGIPYPTADVLGDPYEGPVAIGFVGMNSETCIALMQETLIYQIESMYGTGRSGVSVNGKWDCASARAMVLWANLFLNLSLDADVMIPGAKEVAVLLSYNTYLHQLVVNRLRSKAYDINAASITLPDTRYVAPSIPEACSKGTIAVGTPEGTKVGGLEAVGARVGKKKSGWSTVGVLTGSALGIVAAWWVGKKVL